MGRSEQWLAMTLAGALGCGSSSAGQPGKMTGSDLAVEPGSTADGNSNNSSSKPQAGMAAGGSTGRSGAGNAQAAAQPPAPVGLAAIALRRVDSCDDLLARIHDDQSAKVSLQAEIMRKEPPQGGNLSGGPIFAAASGARDAAEAAVPPGAPASVPAPPPPMAANAATPTSDSGGGAKSASGPNDFSETNVQVEGVDEADIVKTDGDHIYLLHGNQLFVLDSWPAAKTAVTGQTDIEGSALEMFVQDGKAVVFSSVYDQGELAQPAKASDAKVLRPYYGNSFTKITVIGVADSKTTVERQIFVEGNYVSARRQGDTVRTVISDPSRFPDVTGGNIEYRDQWDRPYPQEDIDAQVDDWRDRTIAAIEDTALGDWLPVEREVKKGKLVAGEPRCTDFYTPGAGLASGGVTNVLSFDMAHADGKLGGAMVLGLADEVYANDSVMVLAQRDWRWDRMLIERERTVLHRFEIADADTTYTASGSVTGHIVDQFSIDEQKGVIRVATTARFWPDFIAPVPAVADAAAADDLAKTDPDAKARRMTDNRVITLNVNGMELTRLGLSKPLGKDGESIQSTRFVGDRGYVVTFQQVDPLLVVDLAKPENPTVVGQLTIPGFSEYMHPLDDGHLLTIGQDADTQGRVSGLMLQIFDVSDATKPRRTQSFRFGPNGYSEASQNHKAFTYFKPDKAQGYDGLLAFPYVSYGSDFQSSLQVFQVSLDSGFKLLGAIDHAQLLRDVCRAIDPQGFNSPMFAPCIDPEVRRGLFIFGDEGDYVYSISNGGVQVHQMSDLVHPVATVELPYPDFGDHRVFGGAIGGAANGVMTVSAPPTPLSPPAPSKPPAGP